MVWFCDKSLLKPISLFCRWKDAIGQKKEISLH
jgi:hypothetical protein